MQRDVGVLRQGNKLNGWPNRENGDHWSVIAKPDDF
jgi:hypothetical protein